MHCLTGEDTVYAESFVSSVYAQQGYVSVSTRNLNCCSDLLQIQGLEDLLGSFQGAVDGVPAESAAGVPHASQTYMRIIAKARNEAGKQMLRCLWL